MSSKFKGDESWLVISVACAATAILLGALLAHGAVAMIQAPSQESMTGQWIIEDSPGTNLLSLTMRYDDQSGNHYGWHSEHSFMTGLERLEGLTREQMVSAGAPVRFRIVRDAGAFGCEGWFKDGNGSGHFSFMPNPSFVDQLKRLGIGEPSQHEQFLLALGDVSLELINELKSQGYETPSIGQLVRIGTHGVRLEYVRGLKEAGYELKSLDLLVRMRDHGVSLDFIKGMVRLGYSGMAAEQLIRTRDHGVTPSYIEAMKSAGYSANSLDDYIRFRDHGVSAEFIKEMEAYGYGRMPAEDIVTMASAPLSSTR